MGAILGYLGFEDHNLAKSMAPREKQRALDGFRYYRAKNLTLGQGASILSKDRRNYCLRPIENEEGGIVLICDGGLFGSEKIRQELEGKGHEFRTEFSGEAILHLYEEYGMDFLKSVNGDFAFAIWDSRLKRLILCVDHCSSRPLHYYCKDGKVVFASDIRPLLEYDLFEKRIDSHALDLLMAYFLSPTEDTLFYHVKKVMPSTYVVFEKGKRTVSTYYRIKEDIDSEKPEQYFISKIREELERSVQDRVIEGVPVHLSLGGLDSGTITGILASKVENLSTYSLAFDTSYDDFIRSRKIAEHHGTRHHEIFVDSKNLNGFFTKSLPYFNEPSFCDAYIFLYDVFSRINGKRHLFFNGDGSDPVFGGWKNNQTVLYRKISWFPYFFNNIFFYAMGRSMSDPEFKAGVKRLLMLNPKALRTFAGIAFSRKVNSVSEFYANLKFSLYFDDYRGEYLKKKNFDALSIYNLYLNDERYSFPNRLVRLFIETRGYMWHIVTNDAYSTSRGMQNNCPFLDRQLIDLTFKVPVKLKYAYRKYKNKQLLANAVKDLFPKGMDLRKMGLSSYASTVRKEFLRSNESCIQNLFDRSKIYTYLNPRLLNKEMGKIKTGDWSGLNNLYALFSLGLWYEYFFNDEKITKFI